MIRRLAQAFAVVAVFGVVLVAGFVGVALPASALARRLEARREQAAQAGGAR